LARLGRTNFAPWRAPENFAPWHAPENFAPWRAPEKLGDGQHWFDSVGQSVVGTALVAWHVVVIAFANRTEDRGFESRQGVCKVF
jgi:hypothetical protein